MSHYSSDGQPVLSNRFRIEMIEVMGLCFELLGVLLCDIGA